MFNPAAMCSIQAEAFPVCVAFCLDVFTLAPRANLRCVMDNQCANIDGIHSCGGGEVLGGACCSAYEQWAPGLDLDMVLVLVFWQ
jgi:hypothetical protein